MSTSTGMIAVMPMATITAMAMPSTVSAKVLNA